MSVFDHYARFYDLLYRDKDYQVEADYLHTLIRSYAPQAHRILDFGSGTGIHAQLLAAKGYSIKGVELSTQMLAIAQSRAPHLPFLQGDIRDARLGEHFDVVIAVFHVVSYQTTNQDLRATLATAKAHLRSGGLFIFDCWYGPSVLKERPVIRIKRLEDDMIRVVRIAEPVMHPNENTVDVHYEVFFEEKRTGCYQRVEETHRMRYFFQPELEEITSKKGFKLLSAEEWLTGKQPSLDTWGVTFILISE